MRQSSSLAAALALSLAAQAEAQVGLFKDPEDGGARRFETVAATILRSQPSEDAGIIADVPLGAVLANLGCREEGALWCEVRSFRGGPRGFVLASDLRPAVAPDGTIPTGLDDSDKRARRGRFDVRGDVPCAQERGDPMGPCRAGIARGTGGDATVVVTFPSGFARRLTFRNGEFVLADTTMSGNGTDIDWRLTKGRHAIRVDDQRFDLPDALIFGD
ncbi:MAG: SH3 domain-containing protein [Pseudomonadota bacterium]